MNYLSKFILLYLLICAIAFGLSLFNPTLKLFLYIYLGVIVLFAIFAFFNLYHIVKFGVLNFTVIFVSFVFIAIAVLILFFTFQLLDGVDWNQFLNFLNNL